MWCYWFWFYCSVTDLSTIRLWSIVILVVCTQSVEHGAKSFKVFLLFIEVFYASDYDRADDDRL
jgi:hypothetical protein